MYGYGGASPASAQAAQFGQPAGQSSSHASRKKPKRVARFIHEPGVITQQQEPSFFSDPAQQAYEEEVPTPQREDAQICTDFVPSAFDIVPRGRFPGIMCSHNGPLLVYAKE